jgi:hypothetical protein
MNAYASASYSLAVPMPEINTLTRLRAELEAHRALPLVFTYGGKTIAAGYHVTEVKAAQLSSLDCGANPESWSETIVQLWDIESDGATHMKVAKFLGILSQVERRATLDPEALLIFEAGDSASPMQVFTVGSIVAMSDHVEVTLAPRPATCKPRDRGLEDALGAVTAAATAQSKTCCSPTSNAKAACCT